MQDFDVTLAPGAVRIINVQADYIYYRAGSAGGADSAIEFSPRSGGESVFLYPGQSYRIPSQQRALGSEWAMKNRKGEATIVGYVLMGEGAFQDNRISGAVEVIDGGKAKTLANMAFIASGSPTSDGTTAPALYMRNPAGSGKNIIVKTLSVSVGTAQAYGMCIADGVSGTDNSVAGIISKSQDGVFAAKVYVHTTGAQVGSIYQSYVTAALSSGQIDKTVFQEPIVVKPGRQIKVFGTTAGTSLFATMECVEEAI
ncbi:hypothetical protein [Massilia sp. Leaf139]|uniref:hypothetical protein n=1 Tax=Massilia sp. Leaf139 TaxID=1736272 RepID=UPI000701827D|nr:hypothetical protein [Massilia sp. Leaf139]KQQ97419.1 hypothetical protein ASF77_05610 [Massilia sp. Leaf139]